jgi:hypothetical protein
MVARPRVIFGDGTKNFVDDSQRLRSPDGAQDILSGNPPACAPDEIAGSASAFYANRLGRRLPAVKCSSSATETTHRTLGLRSVQAPCPPQRGFQATSTADDLHAVQENQSTRLRVKREMDPLAYVHAIKYNFDCYTTRRCSCS